VGKEDDEGGDVLSPIYRTTNSSEIRAPRSEPSTVTRDICGTERNEVMRIEADVDEITAVVKPPNQPSNSPQVEDTPDGNGKADMEDGDMEGNSKPDRRGPEDDDIQPSVPEIGNVNDPITD